MDDPLLVGVLHRLADGDEQLQPGPDREPQAVAVLGDRHPAHQLHHEERLAGLGGAAVVHAGDVGVVHQGQRLPLGVEPGQHRTRVHADLDQLERHLPLDRFGLLGPVDGAHSPFAEDFEQRVPAGDDLARAGSAGPVGLRCPGHREVRAVRSVQSPVASSDGRRVSAPDAAVVSSVSGEVGSDDAGGVAFQEPAGPVVGGQQRLDPPAEGGVIPTGTVQVGGPRGRVGPFEGFGEDGHQAGVGVGHRFISYLSDLIPNAPFGPGVRHGIRKNLPDYPPASASASQARA